MEYQEIYDRHATEYDALVNAEDCDGNLLPALEAIAPLTGASVLEVGAGTGRITRLLVSRGIRVLAIDRAPAMLEVARGHLEAMASSDWELLCADARELPVPSGWADVAIAGWVFGHFRDWFPDDWQGSIRRALDEMARALKPGGTLIIVETLGTGSTVPAPPSRELAEYFNWLETEQGLQRIVIRTDYLFPDIESAAATTVFFFGDTFAERVRGECWTRVPECTGLWWKRT